MYPMKKLPFGPRRQKYTEEENRLLLSMLEISGTERRHGIIVRKTKNNFIITYNDEDGQVRYTRMDLNSTAEFLLKFEGGDFLIT